MSVPPPQHPVSFATTILLANFVGLMRAKGLLTDAETEHLFHGTDDRLIGTDMAGNIPYERVVTEAMALMQNLAMKFPTPGAEPG